MFKVRLWFNPKATGSKARDFNWHHVFGIWSAIPLVVVVATATVFSYPQVSDLVYRSFGEEPPARRGRAARPPAAAVQAQVATVPATFDAAPLASVYQRAPITPDNLELNGNGGQPQHRHTLELDARTGDVVASQPFSSLSPGRQARSFIRYLHTGEALGILGQTIAGIVSLTSIIMVWTGLALAYRRLIVPLYPSRRRS
jgi:uncharacterized iron-regulated membrane protein